MLIVLCGLVFVDEVQELTAERANDTFTDRIRPRRPRRRLDDLDALGVENAIECQHVFAVPVTDQEPQRVHPGTEVHRQVPRLLGHPRASRVAVTSAMCSLLVPCSMKINTYKRRRSTVSTCMKSHAMIR